MTIFIRHPLNVFPRLLNMFHFMKCTVTNNTRGRDDGTRSSAGSLLGDRGSKKCKDKKATHLNEKTLDPVGGALRCWIDTSLHHLPDENLNHLKKRSLRCGLHRWANRKAELIKI